ncbi:unnamed protein product [Umbelopsis vinacea]
MVDPGTAIDNGAGRKKNNSNPNLGVQHVESNNLDYDAQRLHDLGYKQEFKRSLGSLVQFGFAFTTMAVTAEYTIGVGPALNAGGPVAMFYGWIVVAVFVTFIGLGMAEIVSAIPTAGGIYFWCYKLSNEKYGRFMAYMAGYVYLIGLITAGMTLAYGGAQFLVGTIIIVVAMPAMAPSHQPAKWVFTEFINNTGYDNVGMVFLVGLLQAGWTLSKS